MIVPSPPFLLFAAVAALVFNVRRAPGWRQPVMLAVNVLFLASFSTSPVAFLPFAAFIGFGYVAYLVTRDGSSARLFVAVVLLTLLAFFWLKRYVFLPSAVFLPFPYVLVGVSYVFFRVLHLIIDGHQGAIETGRVGLLSYLNYTLNFTSLISGPIQFYQPYQAMEVAPLPLNLAVAGVAVERIAVGYFKVAIVSHLLSLSQHGAIDGLAPGGPLADRVGAGLLIATIYPAYIYFNFSGYVDVVIGVARFFRLELPENFDRPFAAENFINFWGRWHMTLSGWLKTYVYNPLMLAGMERITAPKLAPYLAVVAFFVTFFLVGLWHGQTSEFVFYGFLQGGGIAANKLYQVLMQDRLGRKGYRALCGKLVYRSFARGLTFTWFTFTLFWFWSNWSQLGLFLRTLGPDAVALTWLLIFVGSTIVLTAMEAIRAAVLTPTWAGVPMVRSRYVRTAWDTGLVAVTVAISVVLDSPAPDIVYKTF